MMATFKEYDSFDGLGLAHLVQRGVISPAELLETAIEKIESLNPKFNAVIYKMYDEARNTIKLSLPKGLFQGVPFLLKDLISDYAGVPTNMGCKFINGWIPYQDSELVKRFKQAGLVILGKTNVPEFGLGAVTEPELFGPTLNPWDPTRTCGGSSGGSAVAVATRMVPMAHGGDGAGSIRIPAAYCGVFGFKPSRGRSPMGPRFMRLWLGAITEHVITRSVRDSAAMLDVVAGKELGSPISLSKPEHSFLSLLEKKPVNLRIAMTDQPFFPAQVATEYSKALHDAAQLCQRLGHQVESVVLKINHEEIENALMIIMMAEITADLNALSLQMRKKIQLNELEKLTAIAYRAGSTFSAADYAWAIHKLDLTTKQLAEFFEQYDILMTPTMAIPPPLIGQFKTDRIEQMLLDVMRHVPKGPWLQKFLAYGAKKNFGFVPFTPLFNITGQPAMSMPLAYDNQGLPIGIQFASRFAEDGCLLQLAQQLEQINVARECKTE